MSREVPRGWRITTLGAITQITGGSTPSKAEAVYWKDGIYAWATPSDITALGVGFPWIRATKLQITDCALKETSLSLLPPGSVMMTSRATVGFPAINLVPMATNQGFANFHPSPTYDARFLVQWIHWRRDSLRSAAGGSTFPEISKSTLKAFPINLPPLPEQRRIAEILSSVDEAIAATWAVIEQTRKVKQAVLERLLTKGIGHTRFKQTEIGEIPEGWEVATLGELSELVTSGSRGWATYYSAHGAIFIRISNLTRSSIRMRLEDIQRVALPTELNEGTRTRVRVGDILISITADLGIVGHISEKFNDDAYINQHIALVRPIANQISSAFLAYALSGPASQMRFQRLNDSGAKAGLNLPAIRRFCAPVPPMEEQIIIAEHLSSIDDAIDTEQKKLSAQTALKSALMSDLLTGRKRVTDALPLAAE